MWATTSRRVSEDEIDLLHSTAALMSLAAQTVASVAAASSFAGPSAIFVIQPAVSAGLVVAQTSVMAMTRLSCSPEAISSLKISAACSGSCKAMLPATATVAVSWPWPSGSDFAQSAAATGSLSAQVPPIALKSGCEVRPVFCSHSAACSGERRDQPIIRSVSARSFSGPVRFCSAHSHASRGFSSAQRFIAMPMVSDWSWPAGKLACALSSAATGSSSDQTP
jgi:hypothetical protein